MYDSGGTTELTMNGIIYYFYVSGSGGGNRHQILLDHVYASDGATVLTIHGVLKNMGTCMDLVSRTCRCLGQ